MNKEQIEKFLKGHLSKKAFQDIHIKNKKPNEGNIWYTEDRKYSKYPLSKDVENELYQCFKQMKAIGLIDDHEEYHNWKKVFGYPNQNLNYYDDYNSWIENEDEWRYEPGVLFKDLYEGK